MRGEKSVTPFLKKRKKNKEKFRLEFKKNGSFDRNNVYNKTHKFEV